MNKIIKDLIILIAKFNRHEWFKDKDMEDLIPFIISTLYNNNVYGVPVGSSWFSECSKERVLTYLENNHNLFDEYNEWCELQR